MARCPVPGQSERLSRLMSVSVVCFLVGKETDVCKSPVSKGIPGISSPSKLRSDITCECNARITIFFRNYKGNS